MYYVVTNIGVFRCRLHRTAIVLRAALGGHVTTIAPAAVHRVTGTTLTGACRSGR